MQGGCQNTAIVHDLFVKCVRTGYINNLLHSNIKGVVCWYCFDVKPFNLTACLL